MAADLTGLPESPRELIEAIRADEDGSGPVTYEIAEEHGASSSCDVCSRQIVHPDVLAARLLEQYGTHDEELQAELEDALRASPLETGDTLSPNYCSYHAQIRSE